MLQPQEEVTSALRSSLRIGGPHTKPIDLKVFWEKKKKKSGGREKRRCTGRMCPVQVPGGGFQVAGRCVCPVSPEQTPQPKKEERGEKNSQLASHTAGQGLTSSPLVCSPLRRAFTRDGRNTKRAGIDFLLGGVEEEREGCWRVVGLTAHIKLPSVSLTPLPFSSSPSHLPGSGGTLCLSARQWSVSL